MRHKGLSKVWYGKLASPLQVGERVRQYGVCMEIVLFVSPAQTMGVQPLYAGAAPGMVAGVLQVNVRLPQNLFAGSYAVGSYDTLQLQAGDSVSAAVQIWVQP